jgi:hypothetical protein
MDPLLPKGISMQSYIERLIEVELTIKQSIDLPAPRGLPALLADWGVGPLSYEAVWIVAYDADKKIRTIAEVSRGTAHGARLSIPRLISEVMLAASDRFILIHNHPTGDVRATPADLDLTQMVLLAANSCGVFFEDHVIIGPPAKHCSLKSHHLYSPPDIVAFLAKEAAS